MAVALYAVVGGRNIGERWVELRCILKVNLFREKRIDLMGWM